MQIKTKAYGLVDVDLAETITFKQGIIGFEDKQKFILLGSSEENDLLLWLQSIEDENLAFVVIQPRFFKPDYHPKIQASELEDLDIESDLDLLIYSVVVVPEDISKMTANLRAPIIINVKNNQGKQVVLSDDIYKIKELVFAKD
jgi:flagellar assembly factor FliW